MRTIPIKTDSADYPVVIGRNLFPQIPHKIHAPGNVHVLTSPDTWALWGKKFLAAFPNSAQPTVLFLPAGERHKRLTEVEKLADQLANAGADRSSLLIAFGGGIVGDLARIPRCDLHARHRLRPGSYHLARPG